MKFYGKGPTRISLCNGGDTDYYIKILKWTNLINTTLDSLCYLTRVELKNQNFIHYSYKNIFSKKNFNVKINDLENEDKFRIITETVKEINPTFKGDISIWSNVPEKSGLGGSSSLIVSLIKALIKTVPHRQFILPEEIAWIAYKIERKILGIPGGYQDQWAAAFSGGVNYLEFKENKVFLEPLWLPERLMNRLEKNLFLFFMEPRKGDSGNIHLETEKRIIKKKKEDIQTLLQKRENVSKTREILLQGNISKFAELLNKEHENKLKLVKNLLTPKMNKIYSLALEKGAIAGKISGAGSGGCAFFIYDKPNPKNFIKSITDLGCIQLPLKLQRLNSMGEI